MNQAISAELRKLDEQKRSILEFLKDQQPEDLTKALPGKWCMIQAMRHVQMSEEGSVSYMSKKSLAGDEMKKRPFKSVLLLQILYLVFFLRIKFKAPAIISNPPVTSLEELEKDWEETRNKLVEFVGNYPEKWDKKGVYKHPFIGMFNILEGLQFLNAHLRHHRNQVGRITRQIRKPGVVDNREIASQ